MPAEYAAGVVVLDDQGRALLVRERKAGSEDLWHIPSGSVEPGEAPEDAARREAREETGLDVRLLRCLRPLVGRLDDGALVVRMAWLAEAPPGARPAPQRPDEIAEARSFTRSEVTRLHASGRLRMHHTWLFLRAAWGDAPD